MKWTRVTQRTAQFLRQKKNQYIQDRSHRLWANQGIELNETQQRIANDLNQHGLAATSTDELGLGDIYAELLEASTKLEQNKSNAGAKRFLYLLLSNNIVSHDPESVFGRLSLNPTILAITNAYLRCLCNLSTYNVWLNVPTNDGAYSSQLWHRDPGDKRLLKMFCLMTDLTPETGAFHYLRGSHHSGKYGNLIPPGTHDGDSMRSTDEELQQVTDQSDWATVTGKAGTVFFADTRGLHKGGFVQRDHRLLFVAQYTSFEYTLESQLERIAKSSPKGDLAQQWAQRRIR